MPSAILSHPGDVYARSYRQSQQGDQKNPGHAQEKKRGEIITFIVGTPAPFLVNHHSQCVWMGIFSSSLLAR
jgi:hypothetical protein